MRECAGGSDEFVFYAYTYIAGNFKIDNSYVTVYDTVMNGSGAPAAVNSLFEYLVLQNGGSASHMMNLSSAAAMISMAMFDGENCYFDPAAEIEYSAGKALKYFAMNDSRVSGYIHGGLTYTDGETASPVNTEKYNELEKSVSFVSENGSITSESSEGETFSFVIS